MKKQYIVTVEYDGDFKRDNVRGYIEEAVSQWRGSFHPDDPLFGIKVAKVTPILGVDKDGLLREVYKQLRPKTTRVARKLKELISTGN